MAMTPNQLKTIQAGMTHLLGTKLSSFTTKPRTKDHKRKRRQMSDHTHMLGTTQGILCHYPFSSTLRTTTNSRTVDCYYCLVQMREGRTKGQANLTKKDWRPRILPPNLYNSEVAKVTKTAPAPAHIGTWGPNQEPSPRLPRPKDWQPNPAKETPANIDIPPQP